MSERDSGGGEGGWVQDTIGRAVLASALSVVAVISLVIILLAIFGRTVPGGDAHATGAATTTPTATPAPTTRAAGSSSATPRARRSSQAAVTPTRRPATTKPAEVPDIAVVVLNQSDRSGLATEVAADLRAAGWRVSDVGNWRGDVPSTTVYYPIGFATAAQTLAGDLNGVDRIRPRQSGMPLGVLTVILHNSYAG